MLLATSCNVERTTPTEPQTQRNEQLCDTSAALSQCCPLSMTASQAGLRKIPPADLDCVSPPPLHAVPMGYGCLGSLEAPVMPTKPTGWGTAEEVLHAVLDACPSLLCVARCRGGAKQTVRSPFISPSTSCGISVGGTVRSGGEQTAQDESWTELTHIHFPPAASHSRDRVCPVRTLSSLYMACFTIRHGRTS